MVEPSGEADVHDSPKRSVPALIVRQWLAEWDDIRFSESARRRQPPPHFYLFAMKAADLRRLSAVYRRKADAPRIHDQAVQRRHTPERSQEIKAFIEGGFPWSELSIAKRASDEYADLKMPGWLPTAVVANILGPHTPHARGGIREKDRMVVRDEPGGTATLMLPVEFDNPDWVPEIAPLEIIDGQHRLMAFEADEQLNGDYEVPVVAFFDLDITWQAYLFYMINIKPKRINASLAYDLYPVLRVQEWLERAPERASIYRDTRAQELTEVLWAHPESPWRSRINMLGDTGPEAGTVTQAAFIRSLTHSFVKKARGTAIGGLFGDAISSVESDVLGWTRTQQSAFVVHLWKLIANAVSNTHVDWAEQLRANDPYFRPGVDALDPAADPAFSSRNSLLATDQGVRGALQVVNDMCYVSAETLELTNWEPSTGLEEETLDPLAVTVELRQLERLPVTSFLERLAESLALFDWRTASTPSLSDAQRRQQLVYRGSSGYKELRRQLITLLSQSLYDDVKTAAETVLVKLRY